MSAYACEPNKGSEPGVGWNWAKHLAKYHEVWVITRTNNRDNIEAELKKEDIGNITFVYYDVPKWLSFWKRGQRGVHLYYLLWQLGIYKIVKKLDEQYNFDLIHHVTFNEFRTPGFLFYLNKPFIWGPIGGGQFFDEKFRDIFGNWKVVFKERIRNLINKLSIKSPIVNDALKKAVYVLVADPSTYSILPKKYEHKYIKMLETGIAPRREFQKEYNHQRLNLLWVGNIIPRKGLPLILHALANLKDSYDIKLTVVGDGSDKLRCQELAKKLGIQMKVDFVGKLNYLDVQKIYNQADVFIFTSLRDTSGNVVLEAMNNKLPVIALNHHGVSEMVTPDCGIKIEVQSVEQIVKDLSEAIKLFYHNRELLSQMGNKGYERIKQVYDWGKKAEEMSKIYQKAMSIGQK